MGALGGGLCEKSVVYSMNCIPIPVNVSMKTAAFIESLAVARHCIADSGFSEVTLLATSRS